MYHKILVPLDGSETAEHGLHEAIRLAVTLKARLSLLNVITDAPPQIETAASNDEVMNRLRQSASEILLSAKRAARDGGVRGIQTTCKESLQGVAADVIIDEASKGDCDLIVMGAHGRRGFSPLMLGGSAEKVLRGSPVPVLLVRNEKPTH